MLEWSLDTLESQAWQQEQLAVKVRNGATGPDRDVTGPELVAAALRQQGRHSRWEAKARGEYEALWEGAAAGSGNARETCYSVQQADDSATTSWGLLQKVNEAVAEEEKLEKIAIRQTILRTKQEPVPSPGGTMEANDHARAEKLASSMGVRKEGSRSYEKAVTGQQQELALIEDERPASADRKLVLDLRPRSPDLNASVELDEVEEMQYEASKPFLPTQLVLQADTAYAQARGGRQSLQRLKCQVLGDADTASWYAHQSKGASVSMPRSPRAAGMVDGNWVDPSEEPDLIKQLEHIVRKLDVLEQDRRCDPNHHPVAHPSEGGAPGPSSTPLDEFGRPLIPLSAAAMDKHFAGPGERRAAFETITEGFSNALVPVMAGGKKY